MAENELVEIGRIGKAHGIKGELGVELNAENPKLLSGHIFLRAATASAKAVQPNQPVHTAKAEQFKQPGNKSQAPERSSGQRSGRISGKSALQPGSARLGNAAHSPRKYKVNALRMHKGRPLLTLEGVTDRNAAELLRNSVILVPVERLPELAPDEVFMRELPGLNIYLDEQPDTPDTPYLPGSPAAADTENAPREDEDDELPLLGRLEAVADIAGQEIWTIITEDGKEILLPANEQFVSEINLEEGYAIITPPPGLLDIYLG